MKNIFNMTLTKLEDYFISINEKKYRATQVYNYLYKITNLYNNFYSSNKVLIAEDKNIRESWLVLTKIIYENNIKLLNILGIEIPEKM